MAEKLESYLQEFIKAEEKVPHAAVQRRSNETYKMSDSVYIIRQQQTQTKEVLQYATFYWLRLQALKPAVREVAEIRWEKDNNLVYVNNILDTKPDQMTVVIGTLFKEMPLKPSILRQV